MSWVTYHVNPPVTDDDLNALFADSWENYQPSDFEPIHSRSLAYVCAYTQRLLLGYVNLTWDGGIHAFILDVTVHPDFRRRGIGQGLVRHAIEVARERGMVWLHVDYEPHLDTFYKSCGFQHTLAGLMALQ